MEEKYLVLSNTIALMRRELGVELNDMLSLCVSCAQLADSLTGYIVEEINRLPSVLTLSFHALDAGKFELGFARLDVGTCNIYEETRFDHTIHFLIDPLDPRCEDFKPLYWIKQWNSLQKLRIDNKKAGRPVFVDTWSAFWKKLLDYAFSNLFNNLKGRLSLQGDFQTQKIAYIAHPNPLCQLGDAEVAVVYESVRINYNNEPPRLDFGYETKWGRTVYKSDCCAVIVDRDFGQVYSPSDDDSTDENDQY